MLVGINATFDTEKEANKAYQEISSKTEDQESLEVLKKSQLRFLWEGKSIGHLLLQNTIKVGIIGALLGFGIGAVLYYLISFSAEANAQAMVSFTMLSFSLYGLLLGLILAVTIFLILKENTVDLTKGDMKNQAAVIRARIKKEKLKLVEKILREHKAKKVFVL